MTERDIDELKLREYLLGGLAPLDREGLEEQYFADDALFEALEALEEELIRDYLRGGLPRADRGRFESRLAACADLRRKVSVSRGLYRALLPRHPSFGVGRFRWALPTWMSGMPPVWRFVAAASIACLCIGVVALSVVVSRLQARVSGLEASVRLQSSRVSPALSFILTPGMTRSTGNSAAVLLIPSGSVEVTLRLVARREYGDGPLTAILRVGDRESQAWGGPVAVQRDRSLMVTIPASALRPNDYVLELRAEARQGSDELQESYAFSVRSDG